MPEDPEHLDLDIFGYTELLLMARGTTGWQWAVKALVQGKDGSTAEHFRRVAPTVFPEFSWDAFESAFHRVRLTH